MVYGPPDKSVMKNYFFVYLNQNICCGYSKEPSQYDGSFEHPKLMIKRKVKKVIATLLSTQSMFKLMGKEKITIYTH